MAFDFIFMLTSNDRTIPDARARLEEALEGGVRHIGFKDVGLPFEELRGLAQAIRAAGGRSPVLSPLCLSEEMTRAFPAQQLEAAAVLEYMCAEIVELSGNSATMEHHVRVIRVCDPRDPRVSRVCGRDVMQAL